MASITKPILLAVIGILAVVLFLQTSNLITGMGISASNQSAQVNLTAQVGNSAPTIIDVTFSMKKTPSACVDDGTTNTVTVVAYDANNGSNLTYAWVEMFHEDLYEDGCSSQNYYDCMINYSCEYKYATNETAGYATFECKIGNLTYWSKAGTWSARATVTDGIANATNEWFYTSANQTRDEIVAAHVFTQAIDYGTVTNGGISNNKTSVLGNCGNTPIDVWLKANDTTCTVGTQSASYDLYYAPTPGTQENFTTNYAAYDINLTAQTNPTNSTITFSFSKGIIHGVSGTCTNAYQILAVKDT